ncbi:presqualene diphosphate synthase HpnD [Novosphingobium sp.]|uniref:presqualene diphosphate synthase HpnD n=1 Tax=Novosphingobium sp. TaxID=1874826 RepID=UPI001DA74B81|nr:presqualene diphosphate synthase HpnD [Novosphingobium sp.]MBX9664746.1 presqualene diphosphate synthase HpnD [Novosphingobium sp.]
MSAAAAPVALTPAAQAAGSSFYAGMRILPRPRREAMYAIYAFCRAVDDIADDQEGDRASRALALEAWRHDIDALYAGGAAGRAELLREAVDQFGLERADLHAVIDGMAMDVAEDIRWPDRATLDLYCDRVASAVGRLSVKAFGMDKEPGKALAHHLGRALQLTNILRDIDEDAAIGRIYLPREALAAAGIAPETPAQVAAHPRVDTAARILAADAHHHFDAARALLSGRLKGHLIAPRLMEVAYARLLRQMERDGWAAPRTRPRTNKLRLILSVVWLSLFQ